LTTAYLGLGSNLGDRRAHLEFALEQLRPSRVSSLYETAPLGYLDQGFFLNCACELRTTLSPWALLDAVHRIEKQRQRVRPFPNAPRTLDIDLLLYDDLVLSSPRLTLPHPRLHQRAFVLAPLAELLPAYQHFLAAIKRQPIHRVGPFTL
jgi:2-amino-4-hydroxy-6-hydroxymethyldihydropteridine diphosphokinase